MSANKKEDVEQITDLIHKHVQMYIGKATFLDVFAPRAITIRATGNPMGQKLWEEMKASDDISYGTNELLSIDKIDVLSEETTSVSTGMAYAIFTTHSKFTYKGTHNDDVAVYTIIAKKSGGQWKIVHAQRSTGRRADDPKPD
jgi:ketosteroid isomerase-like protein